MQFRNLLCSSSLLIAACAVEPDGADLADVPTSQTSSDISMAGGATWPGTTPLTLGNISQETCFLTGISGSFVGNPGVIQNGVEQGFNPAEVKVFPDFLSGKWKVVTRSGIGSGVKAGVMCVNIPFTSSSVHSFSWSNNLSSTGYTGTANTQCFLRDVWAAGAALDGLTASGVVTRIELEHRTVAGGVEWDMNNSAIDRTGGGVDFAGATATCIDFPTAPGTWSFTFTGPTHVFFNDAMSTTPLRDSYPSGPVVATANTLCAITGIRGNWINPSPDPIGIDDGTVLVNDPSLTTFWKINTSNGRTANVSCVR